MASWFKSLFCRHDYSFIINGCRCSFWQCCKCKKVTMRRLRP